MTGDRNASLLAAADARRFWFDTEFIEDGKTIELISIGIVAEDGRTYYAEVEGVDRSRADPWLHENVFPHLTGETKPSAQIAAEIVEFVGERPEFWAYYADYDWVALCQLYGRMIDLPKGWPMFCRDVKQLAVAAGDPALPKQTTTEHHALADALDTKAKWQFVIDALASSSASGAAWRPKVKALEWTKRHEADTLTAAETILGRYRVWTFHEAEGRWFGDLRRGNNAEEWLAKGTSEAELQAAAQADYEQRILSALDAPPPPLTAGGSDGR